MASIFHDTLFAYILPSSFGSRVFPHPDETALPSIWQEKLSQVSPRHSTQSTLNDISVADTASVCSEATAVRKGDPEKGKDAFLVEWDGPTDPDVSRCCDLVVLVWAGNPCLRSFVTCRTHRTGRVRGRHGSCSRCV